MRFTAVLQEEGDGVAITAPPALLKGGRLMPVRGTINGVPFTGRVTAADSGQAIIILRQPVRDALGLPPGVTVTAEVTATRTGLPAQRIHPELAAALADMGGDLSILEDFEKQQLLSTVNEAKNARVRQQRILLVVQACLANVASSCPGVSDAEHR